MSFTVVVEVATPAPSEEWPTLALVLEKAVQGYAAIYGLFPGMTIPLTDSRAWLSSEVDSIRICDLCLPAPILPNATCTGEEKDLAHFQHAPHVAKTSRANGNDDQDHTTKESQEAHISPDASFAFLPGVKDFSFVFYHLNGVRRVLTRPTRAAADEKQGAEGVGPVPLYTVMETTDDGEEGGAAARLPSCTALTLPHSSLEGIWESLYYGEDLDASVALKRQLLQYVTTALEFSRCGVNASLITWNRLLLFHGPPGTGKTSLAKALAQKLAVRLQSSAFPRAKLIEVNAHSLFSRWFSESGKQVTQLFEGIRQLSADTSCLVCVLLDEVESLAAARQAAMRGNEPSDAIRVVNALLTQIDALQRSQNVLILTTSNLTGAVDPAFADRADLKVYIGPPGYEARRTMLQAGVHELIEKRLVLHTEGRSLSEELAVLAHVAQGLNGRTLKKLPFLAYSLCRANDDVFGTAIGAATMTSPRETAHVSLQHAHTSSPKSAEPATAENWRCTPPPICCGEAPRNVPDVWTFMRHLRKSILRVLREGQEEQDNVHLETRGASAPSKSSRTET